MSLPASATFNQSRSETIARVVKNRLDPELGLDFCAWYLSLTRKIESLSISSSMLQATLSLEPSFKIRSFFVNPIYTNFVFRPFMPKMVDPTSLQHIIHSGLDAGDESIILNPSQQEAVNAINSMQSTVAIHGPGGTGKTFVASEALVRRDYSHTSTSTKDIALFAATTNAAALNIAMSLSKRSGVPHFRLIVSKNMVSWPNWSSYTSDRSYMGSRIHP
jgi:hypothetical protein